MVPRARRTQHENRQPNAMNYWSGRGGKRTGLHWIQRLDQPHESDYS
jgi:hypothetical protein